MLNVQVDAIIQGLVETKVPGRNEVVDINKIFSCIIDYAHNPSSLEAILKSTKRYAKGRIICVFGCGGNRDKDKRSMMGEISGSLASFTIVTTDNPRNENPKSISNEIIKGTQKSKGLFKYIENRKEAIKFAMRIAWKNDVILVCGKGHEDYQILKSKKIHFSDKEVILELASKLENKDIVQ